MQNIKRIFLAALMVTGANTYTDLGKTPEELKTLDDHLERCKQSDNFGECFVLCGVLNQFVLPILEDLTKQQKELEQKIAQSELKAEDDSARESFKTQLAAITAKKDFYIDKQQRCYKGTVKASLWERMQCSMR